MVRREHIQLKRFSFVLLDGFTGDFGDLRTDLSVVVDTGKCSIENVTRKEHG